MSRMSQQGGIVWRPAAILMVAVGVVSAGACAGPSPDPGPGASASTGSVLVSTSRAAAPLTASPSTSGRTRPPAARLLGRMTAAVEAARSGHVIASSREGEDTTSVDSVGARDGRHLMVSSSGGGSSLEIVVVDDTRYERGNAVYLTAIGVEADQASELARSKTWLRSPASTPSGAVDALSFSGILSSVMTEVAGTARATTSAPVRVSGVDCWRIVAAEPDGSVAVLDVADGTALPMRFSHATSSSVEVTEFSHWNEAVTVLVPEGPKTDHA